jgi:hypothetical protein
MWNVGEERGGMVREGRERNEDRLSAGAHGWLDWMAWMAGGRRAGYRQVTGRLKSPPSDDEMQGDRSLQGVGDSVCCWERQRRKVVHAEAKKNNAREVCTEKRREEFQTTNGVWELSEDA